MDGNGRLFFAQCLVHRGVKVVGRIKVCAVVGRQVHKFNGPTFSVGQVFFFQAWKKGFYLCECVFMREVFNLGRKGGWVTDDVVF